MWQTSSVAAGTLAYLDNTVRGEISDTLAKSGPSSTLPAVFRTGSLSRQTALSNSYPKHSHTEPRLTLKLTDISHENYESTFIDGMYIRGTTLSEILYSRLFPV